MDRRNFGGLSLTSVTSTMTVVSDSREGLPASYQKQQYTSPQFIKQKDNQ